MSASYDLRRFVRAQAGVYPRALAELQAGEKTTHWIWFIFPQVEGLGDSTNARLYGITGRSEAEAFCEHEILGERLQECTRAVLDWSGERTLVQIMGVIDAMKFRSSMTLFESCCDDETLFARALDEMCDGVRDKVTLEKLS